MSSFSICSQCLRALRQTGQTEQMARSLPTSRARSSIRYLSSHSRKLQQQGTPDTRPHTVPPPFTAGTVTTNVTAVSPEETPTSPSSQSKSKTPEISTSEMQRHLASQLGRTRGATLTDNLAQKLRKTAKSTTESYITYGLTEAYFKSCAAQAPYTIPEDQRTRILTDKGPPKTAEGEDLGHPEVTTFWFRDIGLQPTFSTWSQITYLHMYLVTVRLRAMDDPKQFRDYQRYLIEHFSNAAEDKMLILHSMNARGIRNRYLKDLFIQWRGLLAAYDEGMIKGDAVLAAAIWRNIWKGKEDVDWEKVAAVVAYMRRAINTLGTVTVDELAQNLDGGRKIWEASRKNVLSSVAQKSVGMSQPL